MDKGHEGLMDLARVNSKDLADNLAITTRLGNSTGEPPKVVVWFLPFVDHALKGGVRTVFMLAEELTARFGTLNVFTVVSYGSEHSVVAPLSSSLARHFPRLQFSVRSFRLLHDDPAQLPPSDLSVATLWTTAYLQVRYQNTRAKFYLVQDFEPSFYAAGAVAAVIEQTYRFDFGILANSRGVAERMRIYSHDVTEFPPGVDRALFFPGAGKRSPGNPFKIVFYGRPSNDRNCFGLGLRTLKAVKEKLGSKVDIISVGAQWSEEEYGVAGIVRNLGLLKTMEQVAELYREADMGLVYMMTPHPSYQPLEYMASGCVVATNINASNTWLLDSGNSLQLVPLDTVARDQIIELIKNPERWLELREAAMSRIEDANWSHAMEVLVNRLVS